MSPLTRPLFTAEDLDYARGLKGKPYGVGYVAISQDDYAALMEAVKRESPDLISAETAAKKFEVDIKTLANMADQGIINRYAVPGFRMVRYRVSELQNAFKKI